MIPKAKDNLVFNIPIYKILINRMNNKMRAIYTLKTVVLLQAVNKYSESIPLADVQYFIKNLQKLG